VVVGSFGKDFSLLPLTSWQPGSGWWKIGVGQVRIGSIQRTVVQIGRLVPWPLRGRVDGEEEWEGKSDNL
jgi:hypothetical protein